MKIIQYLLLILLLSCNQSTPTKENKQNNAPTEDDCPLKKFETSYPNKLQLQAVYFACEADWKYKLQILKNNKMIFEADTLLEYEFKKHAFPNYISDGISEYILTERNDRPMQNKTDVFRIRNNKVDSTFTIPYFPNKGIDIDKDGITEYWANMDFLENVDSETIAYNPIIVYELEQNLLRFDTKTTTELNQQVYGLFHGLEIIDSLSFNANEIQKKWPKLR